jgi:hypothetical protein
MRLPRLPLTKVKRQARNDKRGEAPHNDKSIVCCTLKYVYHLKILLSDMLWLSLAKSFLFSIIPTLFDFIFLI